LKSDNVKISLRLQQFSGNPRELSRKKTPKHPSTYVKKPHFPTTLTHRDRCYTFQNLVFSSATHHPGLAGIVKKTRPPDSGKDFPKERLGHSHFRHLKYHVTGMADYLGQPICQGLFCL